MNCETIIKTILLLGFIYIFYRSYVSDNIEKFSYDITKHNNQKPVKLSIFNKDIKYALVSMDDLREEYQKTIKEHLLDQTNPISKIFMDNRENINEAINNKDTYRYYKTPVIVVKESELTRYTDKPALDFMLVNSDGGFVLSPVTDKYLYLDENTGYIYYAVDGNISDMITVNVDGFVNPKFIKSIKFNDPTEKKTFSAMTLSRSGSNGQTVELQLKQE